MSSAPHDLLEYLSYKVKKLCALNKKKSIRLFRAFLCQRVNFIEVSKHKINISPTVNELCRDIIFWPNTQLFQVQFRAEWLPHYN